MSFKKLRKEKAFNYYMKIFKLLSLLLLFTNISYAQEVVLPNNLIGKANFSYLFWDVYKIELYANDKSLNDELALKLTYKRKLYGDKIAQRSIDEISKQNCGDKENYNNWLTKMKAIFPDVKKGDTLTGIKEKLGTTTFYKNKTKIGQFKNKTLSNCFFNIWLSPNTTEPKLRKKLLGK